MGAIFTPPIPNVAPKMFRVIKVLMRKPKKYFSANQRHCLRNLLHLPLVEPDQSTMFCQLPLINQTLCSWGQKILSRVGNCSFFQVKRRIFLGGKNDEFLIVPLETKKTTIFAKILIRKCQLSVCRQGPRPPSTPLLSTPMFVYMVL